MLAGVRGNYLKTRVRDRQELEVGFVDGVCRLRSALCLLLKQRKRQKLKLETLAVCLLSAARDEESVESVDSEWPMG